LEEFGVNDDNILKVFDIRPYYREKPFDQLRTRICFTGYYHMDGEPYVPDTFRDRPPQYHAMLAASVHYGRVRIAIHDLMEDGSVQTRTDLDSYDMDSLLEDLSSLTNKDLFKNNGPQFVFDSELVEPYLGEKIYTN